MIPVNNAAESIAQLICDERREGRRFHAWQAGRAG